jgi:MFS family permease
MYILEAGLEYLISILVAGSFLATVTRELGISDGLTGILSSIISLGCLFQLFSLTVRRRKVKSFVIAMSMINQLLFLCLYIIPTVNLSSRVKSALFVIMIIGAYVIYNFAHPKKMSWLMSLVDDGKRGSFTANKEIVSLIMGMVFTYLMGSMIDFFEARGEIRIAFILTGVVIFVLMLLHTVTMILTVEPDSEEKKGTSLSVGLRELVGNKKLISVALIFVIYYMASGLCTPFFGTYQIGELGLSLSLISLLSIVGSISRILVSKMWGRYADRRGFARMFEKTMLLLALAYACVAFATSSTGKIMFALYYIINGICMGGLNSGLTNLVFDNAEHDKRADALAICQAMGGTVGFLTTLGASTAVTAIQNAGNTVFGLHLYAQQLLSAIGALIALLCILFIRVRLIGKKENS